MLNITRAKIYVRIQKTTAEDLIHTMITQGLSS